MSDEIDLTDCKDVPKFIMDCPIFSNWVEYKGETFFATLNHERSVAAHKPMIDLHWCITKSYNGIVIKTVQFDKKKFKIDVL